MQEIVISHLEPDEGERLREIRLRALQDSPDSFGSSYGLEVEFASDKWAERLKNQDSRWWVAASGGSDVGLVCMRLEEGGAHLLSMWVAPEARGRGLGSRLVAEAVAWARDVGAEEIGLWAVDRNHAARGLYAAAGFVPSGKVMALPSNPELMESHYVLPLNFREARREDVPAIVALLADDHLGAAREGDPGDERYLAAFDRIAADPYDELIVVEQEGKVVATMQLTYLAGLSRLGSERCQIEAVRVAASTRGQGLGGKMIRWAIGRARARGCAMVQLTSDKSRTDAHRFYDNLGFTASHEGYKMAL
ncbi:GNAT family N-acetyltransferase [Nonomuraea sp. B12E4]|uniref:GNAT family N-acetyltransferase n=1 Tax=Nonomuraea sp. B12E4 TaxID=3153564 RepID=UPI00325E091A